MVKDSAPALSRISSKFKLPYKRRDRVTQVNEPVKEAQPVKGGRSCQVALARLKSIAHMTHWQIARDSRSRGSATPYVTC